MTPQRNTLLCVLLFLSGAAGLVYETVWLYLFKTVAGGTLMALSITLCAFMAGLSLGGYAGAFLRSSRFHPAALYGLIEISLSIIGWICFSAFSSLKGFLPPVYKAGGAQAFDAFLRFFYCGLIAFPVPFLMGLSFPLAVKALAMGRSGPGTPSGTAYFSNTLGGALGVAAAGFVLLEKAGVVLTLATASTANLAAGLAALALFTGRPFLAGSGPAAARSGHRKPGAGLMAVYGLLGFIVMACEIIWMRVLEMRFLSTVYGFSLTLCLLLGGIALGGRLFKESMDKADGAFLHSLFYVGLAAFGTLIPLSGYLLFNLPLPLSVSSFAGLILAQFLIAGAGLLLPALLSGFLFPLAVRLADPEAGLAQRSSGKLYAANTLGAVAAALFTPYALIRCLGLSNSLLMLAFVCGMLLPFAFLCFNGIEGGIRRTLVPWALLPILTLVPFWRQSFQNADSKKKEYQFFYMEGPAATVSVIEFTNLPYRELKVNGLRTEGGTSPEALISQRLQMSLPLSLRPAAQSVLVLGLGSGISLGAMRGFPRVRHVDCAEISPEIVRASAFFEKENNDVLSDPRLKLHLADARLFVSASTARYDLIVGDLFFPWMQGSGRLYTKEHFTACRKRLAAGGLFCQWLPLYQLSLENFRVIANTFAAVFSGSQLWMGHFSPDKPTAALIGFADADTAAPAPPLPDSLRCRFVCGIAPDPAFPQESDLSPKTEFWAGRDFFTQLNSNADFSRFFEEQYRGPDAPFPGSSACRAYQAGLLNAFRLYLKGDYANALSRLDSLSAADSLLPHAEFFLPALCRAVHDKNRLDLMPAAKALLSRVTKRYGSDFQLFGFLGKFHLLGREYPESIAAFEQAVKLNPLDEQALLNLGVGQAMTGNDSLAILTWKKVLVLNPKNTEASHNIFVNRQKSRNRL